MFWLIACAGLAGLLWAAFQFSCGLLSDTQDAQTMALMDARHSARISMILIVVAIVGSLWG